MRANYHTHTPRCGHATGSEREYIASALAQGLEVLGFSDHTPYFFPSPDFHPNVRMAPEELEDYVSTLLALREEYAGRLEIHIGLEAEYYPHLFPRLLEFLRQFPVEYLLLGQHFLGDEIGEAYSGHATDRRAVLEHYTAQCVEGMETGLFSCFAHPDLIHFTGDARVYEREMRRLCRAARENGLPLELNLLGLREGRNYPDTRFWRIAGEEGNAVILGSDAHRPQHVLDRTAEARGRALLAQFGLTPMETLPLVPLNGAGARLRERFVLRAIRPEEAAQAAEIERICFPPHEACAREDMLARIQAAPELFLAAVERASGRMAGFLNGIATDETRFRDAFFTDAALHRPAGQTVMLLGLDVLPQYRGEGLGRELVRAYARRERARGRARLVLTCLEEKVGMYGRFGFADLGLSASTWGGETWHEMVFPLA